MEGKTLYIVTLVVLVISTSCVALRCGIRIVIKAFHADDGLMAIGQVFVIASGLVAIWGTKHGLGQRDDKISSAQDSRKAIFVCELLYLTALIFIKPSICFALYRITTSKVIRGALVGIATFSTVCCVAAGIILIFQCKPISSVWTDVNKCSASVGSTALLLVIILTVTLTITDLACSILPYVILWDLQMDRRLKITIAVIFSLGFVATAALLVRTSYIDRFVATVDYSWGVADLSLWSMLEIGIATIVGSLPSFRPLFRRMGIIARPRNVQSLPTLAVDPNPSPSRLNTALPALSKYKDDAASELKLPHKESRSIVCGGSFVV